MRIGLLFPGQGSQSLGMGKDIYNDYETYRNVVKKVNEYTGLNLEEITFNSSEEILNQTKNTQIAILTMSLGILEILKENKVNAEASLGLSLGEYGALIFGQILSLEDGVKIVKKRGEMMQDLCPEGDWAMAAVLGLDEKTVNEVCEGATQGFISAANYNCPGQIVISGERIALEEITENLKAKGAKRVIELNTAGPFHTKMLKDASIKLREELENILINSSKKAVIKNIDGKAYKDSDDVKDILSKHITNPVRFEDGIKEMLDMGIDTFVEIGPGKTLSGFVRKINKDVKVLNINNSESLKLTLEELSV